MTDDERLETVAQQRKAAAKLRVAREMREFIRDIYPDRSIEDGNWPTVKPMVERWDAALRAAPTPEGETLLRETAGALWDLQSAPDCWCDTGEGNPHTEACMEATRVSRRLVAAKIHLSPASPAPTPATPKHGRSVPEGLCTACGTEPCAEHELPEPTPAGREALPVLVEAFRFTSYQNWVDTGQNKPWTWVTTTAGKHSEEICADSRGRVCRRGLDFQRAHDDGAFPVIAYRVLDATLAALRGGQS